MTREDIDNLQIKDMADFAAVSPAETDIVLTARGKATLADIAKFTASSAAAEILAQILSLFNAGDTFVGKVALGAASKTMYIYCTDGWHRIVPASVDGVQMPTISEDIYNEIV